MRCTAFVALLAFAVIGTGEEPPTAPPPRPGAEPVPNGLHWAFKPVKRPAVPDAKHANPVDRFIVAKLSDNGLSLSPEADRRTLIRRLKFDLLGLPPTPEEVEAFVKDTDAGRLREAGRSVPRVAALRRALGAALARRGAVRREPRLRDEPAAAERLAYRDYVIRAFNDDKPYDQFVREQLAGDALGADAATGFLVGGAWDQVKSPDLVLTLNQRADELHDMVGTTGLDVPRADRRLRPLPRPQVRPDPADSTTTGSRRCSPACSTASGPCATGDEPAREGKPRSCASELDARRSRTRGARTARGPGRDRAVRRPPVNPRLNIERFAPVKAKFVRFVILATNNVRAVHRRAGSLHERPEPGNVALASAGAKATSSGDYPNAPTSTGWSTSTTASTATAAVGSRTRSAAGWVRARARGGRDDRPRRLGPRPRGEVHRPARRRATASSVARPRGVERRRVVRRPRCRSAAASATRSRPA